MPPAAVVVRPAVCRRRCARRWNHRRCRCPLSQWVPLLSGRVAAVPLRRVAVAPFGRVAVVLLGRVAVAPFGRAVAAPFGRAVAAPLRRVAVAPFGRVVVVLLGRVAAVPPFGRAVAVPLRRVAVAPFGRAVAAPLRRVAVASLGRGLRVVPAAGGVAAGCRCYCPRRLPLGRGAGRHSGWRSEGGAFSWCYLFCRRGILTKEARVVSSALRRTPSRPLTACCRSSAPNCRTLPKRSARWR